VGRGLFLVYFGINGSCDVDVRFDCGGSHEVIGCGPRPFSCKFRYKMALVMLMCISTAQAPRLWAAALFV